ncbi:23S rRNA m(5)U-1939 methyltransferase [Litoreibacter meonggei]|uniref:23S rRNA m(5)U-1939 methyltransferase n=1 Tax=Litoreibacter meonggei TaxID=1049199 RepID=A0A497VQS8_9RHOB|nr:class I SAM-dependent RNA methyltransferase [Litoreibacter meonggei]RLJ41376.1 23S rRNA m(5)U-1939 methyltransferase [Litoreibacter meonggei]
MTQTILRLNHKGEGVPDAGAPIPRVLPDEVVEDGRIVTPSVARVAAPCRHFKSCGGCAMQHASDDFVAEWKTDVIRLGLSARGIETDIRPILTSPAQSRRRATLHGRRTKKGAMVGFFGRGSDALIEVPDCKLLDPALIAAFPVLEELTVAAASRKSTVGLVVTLSEGGLDVDIRDAKPLEPQGILEMAALAERHKLARLSWDGEAVATREPPMQSFGKGKVAPPPGAFLQATAHGQAALLACVQEALGDAKQVVDLFAGCGTFTLPAAEKAEVWALEGEAALIDALDAGWRKAVGLKKVKSETRDLFRRPVLPQELRKTDAVIIDPPRAGAEAQTIELAQSSVKRIAAVSCNPISFARDAEILIAGGYHLDWVQPVDQFRWSSHVELAAQFSKPHMG